MLYRSVIRPLLFCLDAETAHHTTFAMLRVATCVPGMIPLLKLACGGMPAGQERTVFGLKFPNAVGLAAGLDKDAMVNESWEAFGFGHVEIGTVTPRPQPGNDRPRLFRLPPDRAIINRMGFNSSGVEVICRAVETRSETAADHHRGQYRQEQVDRQQGRRKRLFDVPVEALSVRRLLHSERQLAEHPEPARAARPRTAHEAAPDACKTSITASPLPSRCC